MAHFTDKKIGTLIVTMIVIMLSFVLIIFATKKSSVDNYLVITHYNLNKIAEELKTNPSYTHQDFEYFVNALTRLADSPDSIIGQTPRSLINIEKNIANEQISNVLLNTCSRVSMFLNHQFHYEGIKFDDSDPNDKINNIIFTISNTSNQTIQKIEGALTFYDAVGNIVRVYNLGTNPNSPIPVSGINNEQLDTGTIIFGMSFAHGDKDPNPSIRFRDSLIRNEPNLRPV